MSSEIWETDNASRFRDYDQLRRTLQKLHILSFESDVPLNWHKPTHIQTILFHKTLPTVAGRNNRSSFRVGDAVANRFWRGVDGFYCAIGEFGCYRKVWIERDRSMDKAEAESVRVSFFPDQSMSTRCREKISPSFLLSRFNEGWYPFILIFMWRANVIVMWGHWNTYICDFWTNNEAIGLYETAFS